MHRQIMRINNAATKGKKRRQRVAWQGRKEKVQGHAPSRPRCEARPGLDDRPPEQNAGGEEARVFDFMPPCGPHAQFEQSGSVPCDYGCGAGEPTEQGCVTMFANVRTGEQRNNGPETRRPKGFGNPLSRTITGALEQNERSAYRHQNQVLRHMGSQQVMIHERRAETRRPPTEQVNRMRKLPAARRTADRESLYEADTSPAGRRIPLR